jgi:O-antigen ligase
MNVVSSFQRDLETTGAAGLALLVLFAGVVTNRYRFDAFPLRPHPEHFATALAVGVLAWLVLRRGVRIRVQRADILLIAYLGLALLSSFLFPPDPRASVQYWLRMVAAVLVYFLVRWLISGPAQLPAVRLGVKALLIFGVLEASWGIASWFLYPLGLNLGIDQYPLSVRGPNGILCNFSLTMYGTLYEPNVFGSVLTTVILVAAVLFGSNEFHAWRRRLGVAIAIMLVALALNASRASLASLAIGIVLIVLWLPGMTLWEKLKWTLAAAMLVASVSVPSLELSRVLMRLPTAPGLADRAPCEQWIAQGMPRGVEPGDPEIDPSTGPESSSTAVNRLLEGQTLTARWITYAKAWEGFVQRPILGNGADSFGQTYTTTAHTPGWISNMFLMSLYDTGLVGTLVLVGWLTWYAWQVMRGWQRLPAGRWRTMGLALGFGLVGLGITFQATTMLWFGFIWWYLALLQAGVLPVPIETSVDAALSRTSTTVDFYAGTSADQAVR